MKKLPNGYLAYKKTDIFHEENIPSALLKDHSTIANVWGKICILEGKLLYTISQTDEEIVLDTSKFGVVEPEVKHKVAPLGKVRFYVEFYKQPS